ncbi:hypothetical protein CHARACLAT_028871, partial [Characodon lateralis]|nr:hypothetical protein [Characodon lateralis]
KKVFAEFKEFAKKNGQKFQSLDVQSCDFYITCFDCDTDETWAQVSVGVLTIAHEDVRLSSNQLHRHPVSTTIIIEGGQAVRVPRITLLLAILIPEPICKFSRPVQIEQLLSSK